MASLQSVRTALGCMREAGGTRLFLTAMLLSTVRLRNVLDIVGTGDVAETFLVSETIAPDPGTVMVIADGAVGAVAVSRRAYDRRVAGVISGGAALGSGVILRAVDSPTNVRLALVGTVYCKAEAVSPDLGRRLADDVGYRWPRDGGSRSSEGWRRHIGKGIGRAGVRDRACPNASESAVVALDRYRRRRPSELRFRWC